MDDLKFWPNAHRLALVPVRSFVIGFALALSVASTLAVVVYYFLSPHHFIVALVAAALTFLEGIFVALMWARQRAMLVVLIRCLEEYRVGASVVGLVFEKMLGVPENRETHGMPVDNTATAPLLQANRQLNSAVDALPPTGRSGNPEKNGSVLDSLAVVGIRPKVCGSAA